ncbi:hypothetical protein TsFJ059_000360 [Trichoderma semiorbis]|uniref:Uncharacterized protein n=1 Tax=Trichoderma semiorbis TaxID=1491008 RepID=A0A9P8HX30_9HYPO|nr:hypothetical protein TsFJ059_000360 [Trichoderma semiorbis]KAH0531540.1 hypothetical protein TsFJ059_000360 [Trichoderma semiorbis]KAH0531541.1 hypothetical protein TsFJ059_000360 [Trichoderma semiorbis]
MPLPLKDIPTGTHQRVEWYTHGQSAYATPGSFICTTSFHFSSSEMCCLFGDFLRYSATTLAISGFSKYSCNCRGRRWVTQKSSDMKHNSADEKWKMVGLLNRPNVSLHVRKDYRRQNYPVSSAVVLWYVKTNRWDTNRHRFLVMAKIGIMDQHFLKKENSVLIESLPL